MKDPLPVATNASPEAKELLKFLYSVDGKVTLTGQHNQMYHMSEISEKVLAITGKYPLIWGGEWGFSDERHDVDNIKYRTKLMEEVRRHHRAGRIIVMTYHQASPTVGEPCDFRGGVQVKITAQNWDDVLDEGAKLHQVWAEHVDRLAAALAILRDEKIPVIFRPYHEMNGDWFWWGGNPQRFKALWDMTYQRFNTKFKLNNLLWAWNPDKPYEGVNKFLPSHDTVDLIGTDIYPRLDEETYPQEWFDRMRKLAAGKPLALSENSEIPSPDLLAKQPWTYFMAWDSLVFKANSHEKLREVFDNPRYLSVRKIP